MQFSNEDDYLGYKCEGQNCIACVTSQGFMGKPAMQYSDDIYNEICFLGRAQKCF